MGPPVADGIFESEGEWQRPDEVDREGDEALEEDGEDDLPEGDRANSGVATPVGPSDDAVLEEALQLAAEPDEKPKGFVVSISKEGLHRKLHFLGACFRKPGIHYNHFRILGELMPSAYDVGSKCTDCFPDEKEELGPGA